MYLHLFSTHIFIRCRFFIIIFIFVFIFIFTFLFLFFLLYFSLLFNFLVVVVQCVFIYFVCCLMFPNGKRVVYIYVYIHIYIVIMNVRICSTHISTHISSREELTEFIACSSHFFEILFLNIKIL